MISIRFYTLLLSFTIIILIAIMELKLREENIKHEAQ